MKLQMYNPVDVGITGDYLERVIAHYKLAVEGIKKNKCSRKSLNKALGDLIQAALVAKALELRKAT